MDKNFVYADLTYNSKNPLARFAHRRRLANSIGIIPLREDISLLDYGCGDGKLLHEIKRSTSLAIDLYGFEPFLDLDFQDIRVFRDLAAIKSNQQFDVVTCFEVLEHFNPKEQESMLRDMKRLIKNEGLLILSVPIEIGFPAVIKNLRRAKQYRNGLHSFKNIARAFLGRSVPENRNKEGYISSHIGFSHRRLERMLAKHFRMERRKLSPFPGLGIHLNSQVFYSLRKKE